jgi:signal transduction histidine kinase
MPQQRRKRNLYHLLMACAMLIVLLNMVWAFRKLNELYVAQGWRAHTLEVITHTRSAELDMARADDAVRGVLLLGTPRYLEAYQESEQQATAEAKEIQRLTADNAGQQQRLEFLRTRMIVRFAGLDSALAMRTTAGEKFNPELLAQALSSSPDGGPTVRYVLGKIEDEEQRLLVLRTNHLQHALHMVWVSVAAASFLDLLLLLTAFEFLIRISRDRMLLTTRTEEIAALNTQLTSLNVDLEARVEQRTRELEASNKELEAFSYSVSHDLRAPLRTIDGFSLALEEDFSDKLNEDGRDYIKRVRNGVQRMGSLIDALLQLSRVTRGELVREKVDISQMAANIFAEQMVNSATVDAVSFTAEPGMEADADPRLLRVALENLIGNAIKYSSRTENPSLYAGSQPGRDLNAGQTVYFIRDNGAGFDMQYVDRLFTAFQRLHGDRDFKGSGIGLATVSRIIRRHHGTIWAESGVGQGATFYFTLAPDVR